MNHLLQDVIDVEAWGAKALAAPFPAEVGTGWPIDRPYSRRELRNARGWCRLAIRYWARKHSKVLYRWRTVYLPPKAHARGQVGVTANFKEELCQPTQSP